MFAEPLPTALDVRKAAVREATVKGSVEPQELQRFRSLLAEDAGVVDVELQFSRDEENRYLVDVSVRAEVTVTCQRCLEPKLEQLDCHSTLGIVWTDREAAMLPRHLDPLIVEEQSCDLREFVEDELILALPPFSYHDSQACRAVTKAFSDPIVDDPGEERPNPFEVLAQLKPGEEH